MNRERRHRRWLVWLVMLVLLPVLPGCGMLMDEFVVFQVTPPAPAAAPIDCG